MNRKPIARITSIILIFLTIISNSFCNAIPIPKGAERDALVQNLRALATLYGQVANLCDKTKYKWDATDTSATGAQLTPQDIAKIKSVFILGEQNALEVGSIHVDGYITLDAGIGSKIHRIIFNATPDGMIWGKYKISETNLRDVFMKARDDLRPLLIIAEAIKNFQAQHLQDTGELYSDEAMVIEEALKPMIAAGKTDLIDCAQKKLSEIISGAEASGNRLIGQANKALDDKSQSVSKTANSFPKQIFLYGGALTGIISVGAIAVHAINCKISSAFAKKQAKTTTPATKVIV